MWWDRAAKIFDLHTMSKVEAETNIRWWLQELDDPSNHDYDVIEIITGKGLGVMEDVLISIVTETEHTYAKHEYKDSYFVYKKNISKLEIHIPSLEEMYGPE